MKCETCTFWVTRRYNQYSDGSIIETFKSSEGQGHCDKLAIGTAADFGCNKYLEGHDHNQVTDKNGAPWQNWKMGPCPNCNGVGCHMVELRPACRHCAGLGLVRHYDDGYVADASWDHPKEKELKKAQRREADLEDFKRRAEQFGLTVTDNNDPGLTLAPIKKSEGMFEGGGL